MSKSHALYEGHIVGHEYSADARRAWMLGCHSRKDRLLAIGSLHVARVRKAIAEEASFFCSAGVCSYHLSHVPPSRMCVFRCGSAPRAKATRRGGARSGAAGQ